MTSGLKSERNSGAISGRKKKMCFGRLQLVSVNRLGKSETVI
jgi:hypothetical protein